MFNNPFLKNDPLLEAVKAARADGDVRRAAVAMVNEEFGVYSRQAVIRENLAAYDARIEETYAALKEGKKADKDYDKDGKVESDKAEYQGSRIRAAKLAGKLKEEEQIDEISKELAGKYIKKSVKSATDHGYYAGKAKGYKGYTKDADQAYKRIDGVRKATDKLTGNARVQAREETDYSAQDRAPVTKSAPKEDPSLPKSYPGAASSAPTAARLSNAKAAVTPIKESVIAKVKAKYIKENKSF